MADFEHETDVQASAEALFGYLSDVGELEVEAAGDGATVTVRLHTVRADEDAHDSIDEGVQTTLANVKRLVEEGVAWRFSTDGASRQ